MKGGSLGQLEDSRSPSGNGGGFNASGFTIIEVLIVLAVTSSLFIMAVYLIGGKQNVAAYNQAIRNVQTELQQVIGEVSSGYYPHNGNMKCSDGGPGGEPLLEPGATEQGSNTNCLFLGKVLQFSVLGTDPEEYYVYTIAGLRGTSASPTVDLASAKARLIAKATGEGATDIPDIFDNKRLLYGLTVSDMYYDNNPGNDIGAVGIVSSLRSLGDEDRSQKVNVVAIPGTARNQSKEDGVFNINDNLAAAIVNPPGGVQICFNSGGTQQSGLISIGGDGRQDIIRFTGFAKLDCAP